MVCPVSEQCGLLRSAAVVQAVGQTQRRAMQASLELCPHLTEVPCFFC